jgi:hypothetical protein
MGMPAAGQAAKPANHMPEHQNEMQEGGKWKAMIRQDNVDVVSTQENP